MKLGDTTDPNISSRSSADSVRLESPVAQKPTIDEPRKAQERIQVTFDAKKNLKAKEPNKEKSEGLNKEENEEQGFSANLAKRLPALGYMLSSSLHLLAGITNVKNFLPKPVKSFIDANAVRFTKLLNSVNYFFAAKDALVKNNVLDFIAKMAYPLAVTFMNLEDVHLAGGICAGLTQIDNAQLDIVKEKMKDRPKTLWNNLVANIEAAVQMFKENLTGGIGRHLKVFLGKNEGGHSMALSGYFITLGALIGVLFGANKRNLWNKLGGLLRNGGGFFGDLTMMLFKDKNKNLEKYNHISGFFYCINAVIDTAQRFMPKSVIDTVNHFNMVLNNLGTYFFAEITRAKKQTSTAGDAKKPVKPGDLGTSSSPANRQRDNTNSDILNTHLEGVKMTERAQNSASGSRAQLERPITKGDNS